MSTKSSAVTDSAVTDTLPANPPGGCSSVQVGPLPRRLTRAATVQWGSRKVIVGGNHPVVVQSMTNTDTVDAIATAIQVKELALAGSEIVRITVNTPEAAPMTRQLSVYLGGKNFWKVLTVPGFICCCPIITITT